MTNCLRYRHTDISQHDYQARSATEVNVGSWQAPTIWKWIDSVSVVNFFITVFSPLTFCLYSDNIHKRESPIAIIFAVSQSTNEIPIFTGESPLWQNSYIMSELRRRWLRSTSVGESWTPVFGRRTDPVLRSACSWRMTTMWINRPLQVSQLGQLSLSSFRGW